MVDDMFSGTGLFIISAIMEQLITLQVQVQHKTKF